MLPDLLQVALSFLCFELPQNVTKHFQFILITKIKDKKVLI